MGGFEKAESCDSQRITVDLFPNFLKGEFTYVGAANESNLSLFELGLN